MSDAVERAKAIIDDEFAPHGPKGLLRELVAEVEQLTAGFVEGIYMGACYCQDGHICTPCRIRERITVKQLTAERDRYKAAMEWAIKESGGGDIYLREGVAKILSAK